MMQKWGPITRRIVRPGGTLLAMNLTAQSLDDITGNLCKDPKYKNVLVQDQEHDENWMQDDRRESVH